MHNGVLYLSDRLFDHDHVEWELRLASAVGLWHHHHLEFGVAPLV